MMRWLFEQPLVRDLVTAPSINSIILWSDNGGHFHSNVFSYWSMVELLGEIRSLDHVEHNFFVEYHGKNGCDAHFAHIGYWVDSYSLEWPDGVNTTPDVMRAISAGTALAAQHKKKPIVLGPLNENDTSPPVVWSHETSTHPMNFDVERLPDHIVQPLVDPKRMECTLQIPAG